MAVKLQQNLTSQKAVRGNWLSQDGGEVTTSGQREAVTRKKKSPRRRVTLKKKEGNHS